MTLVLNLISNFISFLFHPFLKQVNPVQKVISLPTLSQDDFPILRSETEAGRLLSNAQNNHTNDCQVIYAVITDVARIQKKWSPVPYLFLISEIKRNIFISIPASKLIETALKKGIISIIEFNHAMYVIPNHKKFTKHLKYNFIPELNT